MLQQFLDLLQGKQVYGQVFRIFQLLLGDFLHVRSQETVGNVGVGTWIGRDLHELFPYSVSIAGFFQKFPLCGNHRRAVLFFAYPCTELIGRFLYAMPVLADKDKLSITGDGNGIHPVGIFQYIIGGNVVAVGQYYMVLTHSEPWGPMKVFAGSDGPGVF